MTTRCPHCNHKLSREDVKEILTQASSDGIAPKMAGRPAGSRNKAPRSDIGGQHRPPVERKQEGHSDLKAITSAENGRKYGGRPKGSKNKAPRSDKGVPRGPRNTSQQTEERNDG